MARREEGEYSTYSTDEQRRQRAKGQARWWQNAAVEALEPRHWPLTLVDRGELGLHLGGAERDSLASGNAAGGVCYRSVTRVEPTRRDAAESAIRAALLSGGVNDQV
jgi:hypothetical protein